MGFFGGGGASGNVALPVDEFIPSTAKVQSGRFNTYILGQPSTKSQTNGFITWGLAYVPETKNYTTAYIWVTNSAASSEVKLGFYQISDGGQPTTKIVETAGIATTSTGLKTVSFTSTQFSKGYVMVAVASNGSAVLLAALNGSSWGFFRGFNGITWPDYSTHTYANALPDPWSGTIFDASVGNPMIGLT